MKNSDVFNLPLRVEYNGMYKETADNLVDSFNNPINLFGLEKGFLAEAIVRSVNEHDKLKAENKMLQDNINLFTDKVLALDHIKEGIKSTEGEIGFKTFNGIVCRMIDDYFKRKES